eukprot:Colp12_sorted_trinity150504_noHs@34375
MERRLKFDTGGSSATPLRKSPLPRAAISPRTAAKSPVPNSPGAKRAITYEDQFDLRNEGAATPGGKPFICYISADLIRRITREDSFENITSFTRTGKDLNQKIQYMENLSPLRNLEQLNLSFNVIGKIENLDKVRLCGHT